MGQDVEIGIRGLPLPLTGGVVVVMVMVVTVMVVMMVVHFDFVVCLKVDGGENNVDEM